MLILDEPSTGLDPASKKTLWTILTSIRDQVQGKSDCSVILFTHDATEAETVADHIGMISQGRISTQRNTF